MNINILKKVSLRERLRGKAFRPEMFLSLMGSEHKRSGESYMMRCLNPAHEDRHPSFAMKADGCFVCYSCGVKGSVWDLFDLVGLGEEKIVQCFSDERILVSPLKRVEIKLPVGYRPCFDSEIGQLRVYPEYLQRRGVTREQVRKYHIGVCESGPLFQRIVFPVMTNDRLVGWVARATKGEEPKYLYPRGMKKSAVLFGDDEAHRNGRVVVVCEGVMDALKIDQAGYHPAALLGSVLSDRQAMLLRRNAKVIVAPDNDEAGERMVVEATKKLVGVPVFVANHGRKDPGDCSVEELRDAIENAVRVS